MPVFPSRGQAAPSSSPHCEGGGTGHHHTWPLGISVSSSKMPEVPREVCSPVEQTVTHVVKLLPGLQVITLATDQTSTPRVRRA